MPDYRTMEQIAEDDVNTKSLKALVAANSSNDPSAVKDMYADVNNIRSRYGYSGFGTDNTVEATPDMEAEVAAQFPVKSANDNDIEAPLQNTKEETVSPPSMVESTEEAPLSGDERKVLIGKLKDTQRKNALEEASAEKRTAMGQVDATLNAVPRAVTSMAAGTLRGIDELSLPADEVQDGTLYNLGDDIEEYGNETFAIPQEYKGTVATDVGSAVGSLAGFIATGSVGGSLGRSVARSVVGKPKQVQQLSDIKAIAARNFTLEEGRKAGQIVASSLAAGPLGADQAYQRAKDYGIEDTAELKTLADKGVLPGLIQIANINSLLRPFTRGQRTSIFKRLREDAGSEGVLEGTGALGQNAIATSYDEETGYFDGVAYASALGAFSSALVQAPRMAASSAIKKVQDGVAAKREELNAGIRSSREDFDGAAESGDPSIYLNPEDTKNYDKSKAAAVLLVNNQREETTPEQRTKNIAQVEDLYRSAESDLKDSQATAEGATDEAVARQKRQLNKQNELLVGELDTDKVDEIQGNIDMLTARIEEAESTPGKKQKLVNEQLEKSQKVFDTIQQFRNEITQSETIEDLEALKETAGVTGDPKDRGAVAPEARAEAAGKLVTQSMASPDVLSIVDAQAMVEDTDNGLSGEQRKYLTSFADSMQKQDDAKSLNRTKNAIIKGADGFRGIQDYRSLVNSALSSGDVEVAQAYAADLKAFSQGHANKAKALSQAMKQFQSTGKPVQVVRGLTQGSWSISPDKLSGKEMADNQGLVVNVKSKNLVQAVRKIGRAHV